MSWLSQGSTSGGGPSMRELRMRLAPLRQVEVILVKQLSLDAGINAPLAQRPPSRESTSRSSESSSMSSSHESQIGHAGRASEVIVRGGSRWKDLVWREKRGQSREWHKDDLDDARQILHACREDVASLWSCADIQEALLKEGVALRNQSGLYVVFVSQ